MAEKAYNIDDKIQKGKGKEASKLGLRFDVYRKGTLYSPSVFLLPRRTTKRDAIEAAASLRDIVFMDMICDARTFVPGDVFVGENPGDRYILSFKWPGKPNIGFRCDQIATISRPTQGDGTDNLAPYGGQLSTTNLPLVYDDATHTYSFTEGVEATIFCSKSRSGSSGQMPPSKLPLDIKESQWIFAFEILPGVSFKPNDVIRFDEEDYQVFAVDKQVTGFAGQLVYASLKRP